MPSIRPSKLVYWFIFAVCFLHWNANAIEQTVGPSAFDELFSDPKTGSWRLPPTFDDLLTTLREKLGDDNVEGLLYPLGRSLQRYRSLPNIKIKELNSQEQDLLSSLYKWSILELFGTVLEPWIRPFFQTPRIVITLFADSKDIFEPSLSKKLYFGFHEGSKVLEVISYSEAQGRFEFQKVNNFYSDGKPEIVYANRNLCMRCHQSGGPIFALPQWQESNANPQLASYLKKFLPNAQDGKFKGIPIVISPDVPEKTDFATDAANEFLLGQKIWEGMCISNQCRSLVTRLILVQSLFPRLDSSFARPLKRAYQTELLSLFPDSSPPLIYLENPDLPFRDPTQKRKAGYDKEFADWSVAEFINYVSPEQNPANLRDKKEVIDLKRETEEFLAARYLGREGFTKFDLNLLQKNALKFAHNESPIDFSCDYNVRRNQITFSNCPNNEWLETIWNFERIADRLVLRELSSDLLASDKKGNVLLGITIVSEGEKQMRGQLKQSSLAFLFQLPDQNWNDLSVWSDNHFKRRSVVVALSNWLGDKNFFQPQRKFPDPIEEKTNAIDHIISQSRLHIFVKSCGNCHSVEEGYLPAFLKSNDENVIQNQLVQCGPRIWARLAFGELPRDKQNLFPVSMPLHQNISEENRRELKQTIRDLMWQSNKYSKLFDQSFFDLPPDNIKYSELPACE